MLVELRDNGSQTARLVSSTEPRLEVADWPGHTAESLQTSGATPLPDLAREASKGFTQDNKCRSRVRENCCFWGEYVTELVNIRHKEITMSSLSNMTLNCQNVPPDQSYWVSFEEKSFSRGRHLKAYSGLINGKGHRSGDRCVVKVFAAGVGTQKMCAHEIEKCQKAASLARTFNTSMPTRDTRVKFSFLYWAQIDEVSFLKQICFSGRRRLSVKDTVLVEDDLRCDEDRPGRKRGLTLYMDSLGKKHTCVAKHLEAFAHFTYHHSAGQLVVCGLEGVQDSQGFYLKTPVIHSRQKEYGKSDKGLQGISEVFNNHVCNELCKDMIKPCDFLDDVRVDNVDNRQNADTTSTVCCDVCPEYGQVVSQDSYNNNYIFLQGYSLPSSAGHSGSHVGESRSFGCSGIMSGYMAEPSAPPGEDCFHELSASCVPQTRGQFVANWLLEEQLPNYFITSRSFHPSQHMATGCGSPDTSVDNSATVSQMLPSLPPWAADSNYSNHALPGPCSKCVTDNHGNNNKTIRDMCNDDHASASLSTGVWSSPSLSSHKSRSDTVNTSTMASGRCSNCQTHSPHTQNPSTTVYFRASQVLDSCGLPSVNTSAAVNVADRNTAVLGAATYQHVCSHGTQHHVESPPPYVESK